MSYVRWGADSQVYVFATIAGGRRVIECCYCTLVKSDGSRYAEPHPVFTSKRDILEHLALHVKEGHKVPPRAFDSVERDDWVPEEAHDWETCAEERCERCGTLIRMLADGA